jgi:hypothetical protein
MGLVLPDSVTNIRVSTLLRANESDVERLAKFLGIDTTDKDHEELTQAIREHCGRDGNGDTK